MKFTYDGNELSGQPKTSVVSTAGIAQVDIVREGKRLWVSPTVRLCVIIGVATVILYNLMDSWALQVLMGTLVFALQVGIQEWVFGSFRQRRRYDMQCAAVWRSPERQWNVFMWISDALVSVFVMFVWLLVVRCW